ncbi:MAG TPA: lysophospholipase [Myxococcota bacterium]|nr:lysophospholipase [Myxococcota bacterium]
MATDYQEHFFNAPDGIRLFFRRWFTDEPKGLVALVHGFAEHSGRYKALADDICRAGWSVAAFDYRGHGQSGGRRAHIDGFTGYLDDLGSFLAEIEKEGYGGKPVLLGHSLGGLIAARFCERDADDLNGLVLSSPFLDMAFKVPTLKALAGRLLSGIFPTLSLKSGLDPSVLSHDQEACERYAADPLVSDVASARWFTEVLQAQADAFREVTRIKLPLLVLQAGDDRLASAEATRHFFEAAQSEDKNFQLYEDYFHEIFNEVGRDKVVADLIAWLGQHGK